MIDEIGRQLVQGGFMPHGYCISWSPSLLGIYALSDLVTFFSYLSMPVAIAYFSRRRPDFPYKWLLWMFAAFILFCGLTHLMGTVILWQPLYWLDAGLKAVTALVSLVTAIAVWPMIPRALRIPSAGQLQAMNGELRKEIAERQRVEAELKASHDFYHDIINSGQALIWMAGLDKGCFYFNAPWLAFTGRTLDQEAGNGWAEGVHPDDMERCLEIYTRAFDRRESFSMAYRLRRHDGQYRWILDDGQPRYDRAGNFVGYVGHCLDITERHQAEDALLLYANAFKHSGEAIMITDRDNLIVDVNPAFTRLTGYSLDDLRGRNPSALSAGRTDQETYQAMWASLDGAGYWQGELWDRRKDGSCYPKWVTISAIRDAGGELLHYIAGFSDITERKATEEQIRRLAHHDPLTGLLNRFSLESRMEQALASARRQGGRLAVMFIDMDRFKIINDTLGHHAGDQLLVQVAQRLQGNVRESDIVARLGGDEFIVVLTGIESDTAAATLAGKIAHTLGEPYRIASGELHSTPSIGISMFPDDGPDAQVLMKCADTAMYHAKDAGRNTVRFFTAAMTAATEERLQLEREFHAALAAGQFELHYQPQVSGRDGTLYGFEALVRWRHPRRGLIPPAKFIPLAEETGLIEPLGEWVVDEACRQLAEWRRGGAPNLHMAVNLSARQLRSPDLVERVQATLRKYGLEGSCLELEVTESVAMQDPERAIGQLRELGSLGVEIAIDDFGTGYSSLAYLKSLPIQTLKLDRSFVRDIETDPNAAAISSATLALARSLGLKAVAEGVETPAQHSFLAAYRCDRLQGYLFGKPLPPAEAGRFIAGKAPATPLAEA